jgi:alpha-1,3-rhamnosyl/mannosyltransferase
VRIGIDLTALLPVHTGVDRALVNLAGSLGRVDRETGYVLFVNREDRALFDGAVGARLPSNFRVVASSTRSRTVRLAFQQAVLPLAARALGLDVLHSPSFLMPIARGGCRHLLTVYDMTFFTLPEVHVPLRRSRPFRRAIEIGIRRADLVSVPSPSVRRDVLALVDGTDGDRVRVVAPGVEERFAPRSRAEIAHHLRALGIDGPYVLFVGTVEPRKDVPRLVEAFDQAVSRDGIAERLVIAGAPGWGSDELERRLAALRPAVRDRVRRLGYVADADLPALFAGASVFAWPSLEEGFGFPPLEAMASGVPVVASRCSSLVDNLDGAAELVPPRDAGALADAIVRLLRDGELRRRRIGQGIARAGAFRWETFARETVAAYRELASMPPRDRGVAGRFLG